MFAAAAAASAEPAPLTAFTIDPQAERACATLRQPVKPEWSSELRRRLPELRAIWESVGPAMARAVPQLTKKPFALPSAVRLTLCDLPSNSFFGVTVNMRYALSTFTATPVPMRYKVDTAFHESLHEFVTRATPRGSALLAAHARESDCVRNHLHLLALQKAVLLAGNEAQSLQQLIAIDSQLPSGCNRRAWALVNSGPNTYLQYVDELSR